MSTALLNKHNVLFYKVRDTSGKHAYRVSGHGLASLLESIDDPQRVNHDLERVDLYLMGGKDPMGINSVKGEIHSAYFDNNSVDIYFDLDAQKILQSLPLKDFRDILQLWSDFLTDAS